MLVDRVVVRVKAGDGGDGIVAFRRERFVPRGGPDGGDGGDGGDVWLVVSPHVHGLREFRHQKEFRAEAGARGQGARKTGKSGDDLHLPVPPGSSVYTLKDHRDEGGTLSVDLTEQGQEFLIAKGGGGGLGNYHFATSVHQTPRKATPGKPGEEKYIRLELKSIADVGIIGLPNVGKSTLLARLTHAEPKIANYPFTTLEPNLGVLDPKKAGLRAKNLPELVFADIPGLIEGASKGRGLGQEFLRHIERTRVLVHLIDALSSDPERDYTAVRDELKAWSSTHPPGVPHPEGVQLADRSEVVAVNRTDANPEFAKDNKGFITEHKALLISAVTGQGLKELVRFLAREVK